MAAKEITITKKQAEQLYDLYNNIVAADSHYKRCQSDQFRVHVQSVYKHASVREAFEGLRAKIDLAQEDPAPEEFTKPEKVASPRKSVLGN